MIKTSCEEQNLKQIEHSRCTNNSATSNIEKVLIIKRDLIKISRNENYLQRQKIT